MRTPQPGDVYVYVCWETGFPWNSLFYLVVKVRGHTVTHMHQYNGSWRVGKDNLSRFRETSSFIGDCFVRVQP